MEQEIKKISPPALERLCYLFELLSQYEQCGRIRVSSSELGTDTVQTPATVRKDIFQLGYTGNAGAKYEVKELRTFIGERLGLTEEKTACIVGMGALGIALLNHFCSNPGQGIRIVAGFDSNVNRLETITTPVELFPAYRIEEVVARKKVALAIIAVPPTSAQEVTDRCCNGGVSGILNFSPIRVKISGAEVSLRSIDIASEMRILAARTTV